MATVASSLGPAPDAAWATDGYVVVPGAVDRAACAALVERAGHTSAEHRDPTVDRPGRLFAIIGRVTFSAAANFATDLEQATSVTFAGEPMGGSPNLYGDTRPVDLPATGQTLYMATR